MKKIRYLILLAILACCLGAAVGCSGNALSRPVNLKIDSDTLVLSWKPVANAVYYKVKINDTEQDNRTVACNFELEFLSEGTYDNQQQHGIRSQRYRLCFKRHYRSGYLSRKTGYEHR